MSRYSYTAVAADDDDGAAQERRSSLIHFGLDLAWFWILDFGVVVRWVENKWGSNFG